MADNSFGKREAPPSRPMLRPFSGRPASHTQLRPAVLSVPARPSFRVPLATSSGKTTPVEKEPAAEATLLPERVPSLPPSALDVSSLARASTSDAVEFPAQSQFGADEERSPSASPWQSDASRGEVADEFVTDAFEESRAAGPGEQQVPPAETDAVDQATAEVAGLFCDHVLPLMPSLPASSEADSVIEGSAVAADDGDATAWWGSSPEPGDAESCGPAVAELEEELSVGASVGDSQLAIDEEWMGASPPAAGEAEPPSSVAAMDPRSPGASVAETLEGIADRVRRGEIVVAADASASPEAVLASVLASLLTTGS